MALILGFLPYNRIRIHSVLASLSAVIICHDFFLRVLPACTVSCDDPQVGPWLCMHKFAGDAVLPGAVGLCFWHFVRCVTFDMTWLFVFDVPRRPSLGNSTRDAHPSGATSTQSLALTEIRDTA